MNDSSFVDTNIFVYAAGTPGTPKGAAATRLIRNLVAARSGVISFQVVHEFLDVAFRKFSPAYSNEAALVQINGVFNSLQIVPSSLPLCLEACSVRERHQLSWWDSLIIAAAAEAHCSILFSEDMQHGAQIRGVRIVNPFLTN